VVHANGTASTLEATDASTPTSTSPRSPNWPTTPGRAYYHRKLAAGKTTKEALRCLKRRISDAVYRRLIADSHT
jgi:hypothetical protein